MANGIYANFAPKLRELGIHTLPVEGKRSLLKDWMRFCNDGVSEQQFEQWVQSSGHLNISVVLGPPTGLMAVDLDTDDEGVLNEVHDLLPHTPLQKKGKRGYTKFYTIDHHSSLYDMGKTAFKIKCPGGHMDIMLKKHTVLPPSIHPDTKMPYIWESHDDFLSVDMDEVPEFTSVELGILRERYKAFRHQSSSSGGRNDFLKAKAMELFKRGGDWKKSVQELIDLDAKRHGKTALFCDKSESTYHSDDVWDNARRFYLSNMKTFLGERGKTFLADQIDEHKDLESDELVESVSYPLLDQGFWEQGKNGGVLNHNALATYLVDHYKMYSDKKHVMLFDDTHYVHRDEHQLTRMILDVTNDRYKPSTNKSNVFDNIYARSSGKQSELEGVTGLINLPNGVLDIQTGKLMEHSHLYDFKHVLPFCYDKDARCPTWELILDRVLKSDSDTIKCLQQLFAYVIAGTDPYLESAFYFYGDGKNGKSTVTDCLGNLVGKENRSALAMEDLGGRFSLVGLENKLVNLADEGNKNEYVHSAKFKSIVAGQPVNIEGKGVDTREATITAKLICSTNDMPKFRDVTFGLLRRLTFFPFTYEITEADYIPKLKYKLREELPGILNWALSAYKDADEYMELPFTPSQAMKELKQKYELESNPVKKFYEEYCYFNPESADFTYEQELFEKFQRMCEQENNRAVCSFGEFKRRFHRVIFSVEPVRQLEDIRPRRANGFGIAGLRCTFGP